MRRAFLVLFLVLTLPLAVTPAQAAQRQGMIEVSPFLGVNLFDHDLGYKTGAAAGVRGGYYFKNEWEAEAALLYAWADGKNGGDISLTGIDAGILYHPAALSTEKFSPYLCAGLGSALYDYDNSERSGREKDWSLHYGVGAKYFLSERLALRGDIRQPVTREPARHNLLVTLGLSWFFDGPKNESVATSQGEALAAAPREVPPAAPPVPVAAPAPAVPQTPTAAPVAAKTTPEPEQQKAAAPQSAPAEKPAAIVAEAQPKREIPPTPEIANPTAPEAKPPSPAVAPAKKPERMELSLRFALNSAVVNKKYREEVAALAKFLTENPTARITIEGHADVTGEAQYNQHLSERRGKALAKILTKTHKIAPERIVTVGYGETRPVASNDTAKGRAENRRVLATVTIGE